MKGNLPSNSASILPLLLVFIVTLWFFPLMAKATWQQEINYDIDVTLDDKDHYLRGQVRIEYVNNSPETLEKLHFHCWPNAYSSNQTPFARQKLENKNTKFYFSEESEKGKLDSLNFTHKGKELAHSFEDPHKEMGVIKLNESLAPGQSLTIRTPFRVKIPKVFSRLGHNDQAYQISQWYPKVSLYDEEGWHTMPYLDQGEYFNEFGQYNVSITLPANYVVGATGKLKNPAEKRWLKEKSREFREAMPIKNTTAQPIPESSDSMKTVVFEQNNVHDFAWFADKRFNVLMDTVGLKNRDKKVETYTYFLPQNGKAFQKGPDYIENAIQTLSQQVGPYSYETYTVVNGELGAGAGMEYPTLTVVGNQQPKVTIFHEVTHNWFQGEVAFNERRYPFLDEGLTSFYQYRYFENWNDPAYYQEDWNTGPSTPLSLSANTIKYTAHQQERVAKDQAPGLPSRDFTAINYFSMVYGKAAWLFQYLYGYLGRQAFDKAMQQFYKDYRFKHPGPEDLRRTFEKETGDSLKWFFQDLMKEGQHLDYAVKGFANKDKTQIQVANEGEVKAPVLIALFQNEELIEKKWIAGFEGDQVIDLPAKSFDKVKINPFQWVPERNHRNNTLYRKGLKDLLDPLSLNIGFNSAFPGNNEMQVLPTVMWNGSDGLLLGGTLSNSLIPSQSFDMVLMPLYGLKSERLAGTGLLSFNQYAKNDKRWHKWQIGLKGKRFSYENQPKNLVYSKLKPFAEYQFKNQPLRSAGRHTFRLSSNWIWREDFSFSLEANEGQKDENRYYLNQLTYQYENQNTLKPFESRVTVQQHADFVKTMAEIRGKLPYNNPGQGFRYRVFAGKLFSLSDNVPGEYSFLLGNRFADVDNPYTDFRDKQDYLYEQSLLDRGARSGVLANQVWMNDGFLKAPTALGSSRDWLVSANLMTTIPGNTPLRLFADVGTSESLMNSDNFDAINYDAGVAAVLWKDVLELYYPIFFSSDLDNILENRGVNGLELLQFRFNINPYDLLDSRQQLNKVQNF